MNSLRYQIGLLTQALLWQVACEWFEKVVQGIVQLGERQLCGKCLDKVYAVHGSDPLLGSVSHHNHASVSGALQPPFVDNHQGMSLVDGNPIASYT